MAQVVQSAPAHGTQAGKGLRIGLWVVQGLLAFAFLGAGLMKLATPYEQLAASQAWARATPTLLVKIIGVCELAGALGVMLPAATRIKPGLTPLAALGFVVLMVLAAGLHVSIGEPPIPNVVLGALAAFVAWGRWKKAPIAPR